MLVDNRVHDRPCNEVLDVLEGDADAHVVHRLIYLFGSVVV